MGRFPFTWPQASLSMHQRKQTVARRQHSLTLLPTRVGTTAASGVWQHFGDHIKTELLTSMVFNLKFHFKLIFLFYLQNHAKI